MLDKGTHDTWECKNVFKPVTCIWPRKWWSTRISLNFVMQYVKVMIYKCSHVGDMHFFFKLLITETMNRSNEFIIPVWMVSSTPNDRTTFIINGCSIPNKHNYDGISNGIAGGNRQTHNVKHFLETSEIITRIYKTNFKQWRLSAYALVWDTSHFESESHLIQFWK